MAGLLDFALGFGAGAAGGFAEQKKADLEEQRKANLMRLQAHYKGEQEREKEDETTALILEAQAGSTAAQARLAARNVSWQPKPQDETSTMKEAKFLFPDDPEAQQNFITQARLRPSTTVNLDQGSNMFAEIDRAQYENIVNRATQSQGIRTDARIMKEAIASGNFETGFAAEPRVQIGRLGNLFGLDTSEIPIIGSAPTAEVIESTTSKMTQAVYTNMLEGTPIRGSTAIFENIQKSMPNLTYTPEGNKILADIAEAKANYDITIYNKLMEYRQKYADAPNPLFPPGEQSFYQWKAEYDATDPVITDEIRNYLNRAAKAPLTTEQIANDVFNFKISVPEITATTPEAVSAQLDSLNVKIGDRFKAPDGKIYIRQR